MPPKSTTAQRAALANARAARASARNARKSGRPSVRRHSLIDFAAAAAAKSSKKSKTAAAKGTPPRNDRTEQLLTVPQPLERRVPRPPRSSAPRLPPLWHDYVRLGLLAGLRRVGHAMNRREPRMEAGRHRRVNRRRRAASAFYYERVLQALWHKGTHLPLETLSRGARGLEERFPF